MTERSHASATIDVRTYEPQPYQAGTDGPDLVEIHVTERLSGDIEGDGVVRFLQALRADTETVQGTSFVVPGSGTCELTGLRGEGGFTAQLGKSAAALDHWFD
jgi:hypothetical protein